MADESKTGADTPPQRVRPKARMMERIPNVHDYSGGRRTYGNQYEQVGEVVEMWADLIEGYGYRAEEFFQAFDEFVASRSIPEQHAAWDDLTATGFNAPARTMRFYRRNPVVIAVYIARQGADLYVSWRAFVQGKISEVKLALVGIFCVFLALLLSLRIQIGYGAITSVDGEALLRNFIILAVACLIGIATYGVFYRKGDYLALLRNPIYELHYDDVTSLASAVHKSLIAAADKIGIDITKLEPREPVYSPRRRPRI